MAENLPSPYIRNLRFAPLPRVGPYLNVPPIEPGAPMRMAGAGVPMGPPAAAAAGMNPLMALGLVVAAGLTSREASIAATGGRKIFETDEKREAAKPKNVRKYLAAGVVPSKNIQALETTDPKAAAQLKDIQGANTSRPKSISSKPAYKGPRFLGKLAEAIGDKFPGFIGNVVRPDQKRTDQAPNPVVPPPNPVVPPPNPVVPPLPVAKPADLMSNLKDFFIDKDRGGMTMHGLLTLGALARVVTGAREKNGGMEGGGAESDNLLAFMRGGAEGVKDKQDNYAKEQLAREKMRSDESIAAAKTSAKEVKPPWLTQQHIGTIRQYMYGKPNFLTSSQYDSELESWGIDPADTIKYPTRKDAWRAYWEMQGMGDAFDLYMPGPGLSAGIPPGVTVTPH